MRQDRRGRGFAGMMTRFSPPASSHSRNERVLEIRDDMLEDNDTYEAIEDLTLTSAELLAQKSFVRFFFENTCIINFSSPFQKCLVGACDN